MKRDSASRRARTTSMMLHGDEEWQAAEITL
jgi:hypothetical protein